MVKKRPRALKKVASAASSKLHARAFRAAQLYYVLEESQGRIARTLKTSKASVSRLLDYARRHRMVQFLLTPPLHTLLSQRLADAFRQRNSPIRTVLVADGEGRTLVGHAAARYFDATAPPQTILVLDGGWTVNDFVHALAHQTRRHLTIVPIAADPPSYKISALELITLLGAKCVFHSLQKIPHLVHLKPDSMALRKKLQAIERVARRADFVVLGIGPWKPHFTALDFVEDLGLDPRKWHRKKICRKIVAVCGYFPLSAKGTRVRLREIETVLPHALPFDRLCKLARSPRTNVLILAASAIKAEAVLAATRAGMCNTLVLDRPLAVALLRMLEHEDGPL